MSPIDKMPTVAKGAMLSFELKMEERSFAAWKSNGRSQRGNRVVTARAVAKIRGSRRISKTTSTSLSIPQWRMKPTTDEFDAS